MKVRERKCHVQTFGCEKLETNQDSQGELSICMNDQFMNADRKHQQIKS